MFFSSISDFYFMKTTTYNQSRTIQSGGFSRTPALGKFDISQGEELIYESASMCASPIAQASLTDIKDLMSSVYYKLHQNYKEKSRFKENVPAPFANIHISEQKCVVEKFRRK